MTHHVHLRQCQLLQPKLIPPYMSQWQLILARYKWHTTNNQAAIETTTNQRRRHAAVFSRDKNRVTQHRHILFGNSVTRRRISSLVVKVCYWCRWVKERLLLYMVQGQMCGLWATNTDTKPTARVHSETIKIPTSVDNEYDGSVALRLMLYIYIIDMPKSLSCGTMVARCVSALPVAVALLM